MAEQSNRSLKCSSCSRIIHNVGITCKSTTCDVCVQKGLSNLYLEQMKGGFNMGEKQTQPKEVKVKETKVKETKEKRVTLVSIVSSNKSKSAKDIAELASTTLKKNITEGRVAATIKYLAEKK